MYLNSTLIIIQFLNLIIISLLLRAKLPKRSSSKAFLNVAYINFPIPTVVPSQLLPHSAAQLLLLGPMLILFCGTKDLVILLYQYSSKFDLQITFLVPLIKTMFVEHVNVQRAINFFFTLYILCTTSSCTHTQ